MSIVDKLFKVPLADNMRKVVTVNPKATRGATVGVDLMDANGRVYAASEIVNPAATSTEGISVDLSDNTTDDLNEGAINLYFTVERAQDAVGAALTNTANILFTYNDPANTISADLTDVTVTAGGSLKKYGFDAKGRLSLTDNATTTDLVEGANLYYTDARADARITVQKGQPSGLCPLDSGSLIPVAFLPPLAVISTFIESSQAAMLALTAQPGDICVRTDLNETFILAASPASTLGNWVQLLFPGGSVTSFNGRTGPVTPQPGDYVFSDIGSKPTTVAGYGITDAVPTARQVKAGSGLVGGGALTADVTLSVDLFTILAFR